ncbi:MAG TPA: hypothetical protein VE684_14430 [Crenalkalicoccus sp.]|jgi:hypothetical protein|nr:hypothetical protein [Crenalkalicoccus sp.]
MPVPDPLREAFRQRALGAVERMAREAPPEALVAALAASTDVGTLARATADQAASDALRRLDPLAAATARGAEARVRLSEEAGGLLSTEQVATLLGITRAAVDKRRSVGKTLAVRVRGDWHYPAAQFRDGEVLPGIPEVLAHMPDASGWAILSFLLAEESALGGRTPLAALRTGELKPVLRLVRGHEVDAYA